MAEHLGVSGVTSLMERFLQNPGTSLRRWSDLLCSRRCLHDHPHQTLEKESSQYTPQLVKTGTKEIMKVIRSQTCCSVTIDSKSHLVAQAVRLTARVTWWLKPCQQITQSSKKMHIVDSVKKNSEPWILLVRKNEKQPEPWCLDCTWNLAILILEE